MLKKVKFKETFNCFKKNKTFKFKEGVNLLVGEQGSGKSSLLQAITSLNILSFDFDGDNQYKFLDLEKHNPRKKSEYVDNAFDVHSRFMSHGESNNLLLGEIKKAKNIMILLDEPDSNLSIRSCHKLIKLFNDTVKRKCQIIAAVHNPIIINAYPEVLSLEHNKWMSSKNFINSHKI